MKLTTKMAARFREIIFDGDWVVGTNYKDQLSDLSWQQATTKIDTLNTIALLTFHINYYIAGVLNVFEGGKLEIKDRYSFDLAPIKTQENWNDLLNIFWTNAGKFANSIDLMAEEKLEEIFVDKKYGNYQRNIEAILEHSYYHLGQITLIKKMIIGVDKINS